MAVSGDLSLLLPGHTIECSGMTMLRNATLIALMLLAPAASLGAETITRPVRRVAFERVLVPFAGEQRVADRYWATQFWLRNVSERPVPMVFPFPCQFGHGCAPIRPFTLAPGQTLLNPTYAGGRGVFMQIPGDRLRDLAYSIRVEDIAGLVEQGRVFRGTELPLVREEQFSRASTLLNVPVAVGSLKLLRVFGLTTDPMRVRIEIHESISGEDHLRSEVELELVHGIEENGFDVQPAFGEIDLTSTLTAIEAAQGRVTLRIVPAAADPPVWAFLAVLERDDRSFTIITPGR